MKIIYTRHAVDKLLTKESNKFHITKKKIERVIKEPTTKTVLKTGVIRAVGLLDDTHSLCIAFKREKEDTIKIITFFPAEKGRYENKILS